MFVERLFRFSLHPPGGFICVWFFKHKQSDFLSLFMNMLFMFKWRLVQVRFSLHSSQTIHPCLVNKNCECRHKARRIFHSFSCSSFPKCVCYFKNNNISHKKDLLLFEIFFGLFSKMLVFREKKCNYYSITMI